MERSGNFDYILLETSGLADPGNIAPLFWVDDGLGSTIYLDGIVTLVDAKNIMQSLEELSEEHEHPIGQSENDPGSHVTTAHLQISHADIIVLNKIDTVSREALAVIKARIESINGLALIMETSLASASNIIPQSAPVLDRILDLHAYDTVDLLATESKGHSHLDPVRFVKKKYVSATYGRHRQWARSP